MTIIRYNRNEKPPFEFLAAEAADEPLLFDHAKKAPYRHSSYSAAQIYMWKKEYRPAYAVLSGCLVYHFTEGDLPAFSYPYAVEMGADERAALESLRQYAEKTGVPLRFFAVPKEKLAVAAEVFPAHTVEFNRTESDYLYRRSDLAAFLGKKYAGQRNHVRRFYAAYPSAVFRPYTADDRAATQVFFERYAAEHPNRLGERAEEFDFARAYFLDGSPEALRFLTEVDGAVVAVVLGAAYGDTVAVHIEKALSSYEGVYPATVQAFASALSCTYLNREDDAGTRGLRSSKLQYEPCEVIDAMRFTAHTGLERLSALPTIDLGEGLTLSALQDEDAAAYDALCLDDEVNRLFGYDYRSDEEHPSRGYFLRAARTEFARRTGAYFAVRKEGVLCGESALTNFDYEGGCNFSVRLAATAQGKGYGARAAAATVDFALYTLGLRRVNAYCFKENAASEHALRTRMRLIKEDDEFFYFSAEE